MKAILLGLILALSFTPLLAQEEPVQATLSVMPPGATGLSYGYALWSTGQIENPYGCVFGSVHPEQGVAIYGAGRAESPAWCQEQENAIGMIVFVHAETPQEKVCEAARVVRKDFPKLVLMGTIHGLVVHQGLNGLDYMSVRATWCATPIEEEQYYRPIPPADAEPASIA